MHLASPRLSAWFDKNVTIVLPSRTLVSAAQQQFIQYQHSKPRQSWTGARILSFDAWMFTLWQEARYRSPDLPSVLSNDQERALWLRTIEWDHPQIFDSAATARLAQTASLLLSEWHLPSEGESWSPQPDAQRFQIWLRLARKACRENGWLLRTELARQLPAWLAKGLVEAGPTVFVGFDRTPALDAIDAVLGTRVSYEMFETDAVAAPVPVYSRDDMAGEADLAARVLRAKFEKRARSLALFVPDLRANAPLVVRSLENVFGNTDPLHVERSGTLIDQPVLAAAWLLLKIARPRIGSADAGALLRSPYVAGATSERHPRALADLELRRRRELDVSLEQIRRVCGHCPRMSHALSRIATLLPQAEENRPAPEWSRFFSKILEALEWPGRAPEELTEEERDGVDRWKRQLSALASLGLVLPDLSMDEAFGHLRRLLSAPARLGDWSRPIHVLDADEARGLRFDTAVCIGLGDDSWPTPSRLSPLAPLALQRAHHVPGAAADSFRDQAVLQTRFLLATATDISGCYHGVLSGAVAGFATVSEEPNHWRGKRAIDTFKTAKLEIQDDGRAPAFVEQTAPFRGGSAVIRSQSLCPFRAFTEYRLRARTPEDASFGFDARDRGSFMHAALQFAWEAIGSQRRLIEMSAEELHEAVTQAVEQAVQLQDGPLHRESGLAERERLHELLLDWLNLEKGRCERFTVQKMEEQVQFAVPGLTLDLRVDRIDRLDNGGLILIDYKSGAQTRPKLYVDEGRPQEPQLLVYAAAVEEPVEGIFFGQLKPREVRAVGFSKKKQFKMQTAEVRKDWDGYIQKGREAVQKLAADFVRGEAAVDPLSGACNYCGSKPICRVRGGE